MMSTKNQDKNYLFVDNIRIISMVFIVLYHVSEAVFDFEGVRKNYNDVFLIPYFLVIQFGRFGNICFFLVSGFLFGVKSSSTADYDYRQYLRKRWKVLAKPTLFLSVLCSFNLLFHMSILYQFQEKPFPVTIVQEMLYSLFFGWGWFVLGLLINLSLLIAIIKYIPSYLSIITLSIFCICIAIYMQSDTIQFHNHWLLGFFPILSLGYLLGTNLLFFDKLIAFLSKNSVITMGVLIVVYVISVWDAFSLYANTSISPWFNLRPLNQLYAVFCFFFMCVFLNKKIDYRYINPRTDTVGIYYVHFVVVAFFQYLLYSVLYIFFSISDRTNIQTLFIYPLTFVMFAAVMTVTFYIISKIKRSPWASYIGIGQ